METPKLQWSAAAVSDGVLTVPLEGDRPEGWDGVFERTVTLLGGGEWDEVKLKSDKVRVKGVREGAEDVLHHFLEGVVQEANAAVTPDDDEDDASGGDGADEDDPDADLTARFREFGESSTEPSDAG